MKVMQTGKKTVSIEEHLNKIRPFLKRIINNPKKSDMRKIQLTVAINFFSLKTMWKND